MTPHPGPSVSPGTHPGYTQTHPGGSLSGDRKRGRRTGQQLILAVSLWLTCGIPLASCGNVVERWFTVGSMSLNPTCLGARPSVVVNQSWPGPTIYANDGDTIKVHMFNNQSIPITIHWHGISQFGSQWYDGVPGITQCPIPFKSTFTYTFQIQGQWGTFWWHSHVAQLRNTLHGALIIRPPINNAEPLSTPIADEFLMLGGDWFKASPEALSASILSKPFPGYPLPDALHLNGRSLCSTGPQFFSVRKGSWYRLRIINTAMWASFNLQIQGHTLVLHETEGGYLSHTSVSSLDVYPGQSYSVLLYTNKSPGNYWIALNGRYDVAKAVRSPALAVLTYIATGVTKTTPSAPVPTIPSTILASSRLGPMAQAALRSPHTNQVLPGTTVDKLIVLELNINTNTKSGQQVYSMNNISFTGAASGIPFLLADYNNQTGVYRTIPSIPSAKLRLQKDGPTVVAPSVIPVNFGDWVQIVFQNHVPPGGLHPWHLHGYNFYVVAQGTGTFDASNYLQYSYNLHNPPYRNTVAMFENTWVAVRFQATNPGQWILHCHLEQHADQGLIAMIKVNWPKQGTQDGPPPLSAPPKDFPKC